MWEDPMTPQQVRLRALMDSRNWGPFTDEESAHLNAKFKPSKREATPFVPGPELIRYAAREEWPTLKTIIMEGE
jgi:hypothetical protein